MPVMSANNIIRNERGAKIELSFYFVIGSSGIILIYNPNGTM